MNKRKAIVLILAFLSGIFLATGIVFAAKTYKYKCPKCKLIQEYGTPGIKKCPNDGSNMIRQN